MHIADFSRGMLGANAIVGGGIALATGAGLASSVRGSGQVAVAFFGDGAANQGVLHESLNLAAIWKLPVIYVCENNGFAESTPAAYATSVPDVASRAVGLRDPRRRRRRRRRARGLRAARSGGRARAARARGRRCSRSRRTASTVTSRAIPTATATTRIAARRASATRSRGCARSCSPTATRRRRAGRDATAELEAAVSDAVEFARASPFPDPSELDRYVYPEQLAGGGRADGRRDRAHAVARRRGRRGDAAGDGGRPERDRDGRGRRRRRGPRRRQGEHDGRLVRRDQEPLSALRREPRARHADLRGGLRRRRRGRGGRGGLRPVVDAMWADFTGLAFDQIYNQAGKMSYMFGGQARLPLTIRVAMGSGLSAAAQHSGTLYAIYTHLPGIKVVVPSTPYDAKGLLLESIFDDSPVMFFEHLKLYVAKGRCRRSRTASRSAWPRCGVPAATSPSSRSRRWSTARSQAAELLAAAGTSVEVIDPRTLSPLDVDTIVGVGGEDGRARRRRREPAAVQRRLGDRGGRHRAGVRLPERAGAARDRAARAGALHAVARGGLRADRGVRSSTQSTRSADRTRGWEERLTTGRREAARPGSCSTSTARSSTSRWRARDRRVVLVHGLGLSGALWNRFCDALGSGHTLVRVDLRGAGARARSSRSELTLARWADDLAAVLERLGLERPTVVGHSLGAGGRAQARARAARAARRARPDRRRGRPLEPRARACSPRRSGSRAWGSSAGSTSSGRKNPPFSEPSLERDPAILDEYRNLLLENDAVDYVRQCRAIAGAEPLSGRLGEVGQPVLVVVGGLDDRTAARARARARRARCRTRGSWSCRRSATRSRWRRPQATADAVAGFLARARRGRRRGRAGARRAPRRPTPRNAREGPFGHLDVRWVVGAADGRVADRLRPVDLPVRRDAREPPPPERRGGGDGRQRARHAGRRRPEPRPRPRRHLLHPAQHAAPDHGHLEGRGPA